MRMDVRKLGVALVVLCPLVAAAQQPAQDPVEEYAQVLRETRGLELYNALRERQIATQQTDIVNVQTAIEGVDDLKLQLPPLLIRMVDGLNEFVKRDVPFLTQERQDRIASLYTLIEEPKATDVTKLRRILEAWSIEVEYGGAFQTYTGKAPIENDDRDADFVHLGRVGLIFQTSDDEGVAGAWDYRNNSWVILGSEHRNSIRQLIRMARNQIAPELVLLPTVPAQPN